MGQLILVSSSHILPSQDFLKEPTIKYILQCLHNNDLNKLPPAPIVRFGEQEGEYVAIDGHNLIAVYDYLSKPCQVYLAHSREDRLPGDTKSVLTRNKELYDKYESSIITAKGLKSFKHLRQQYKAIADPLT